MRAATRPHRRFVSTSSPTMTHEGGVRKSTDPGAMANLAFRAPSSSWRSPSRMPMWESRPERSERWTASGSAGSSLGVMRRVRMTCRSWPWTSCHSRTRR
jgi:hypothetical protein